MNEEEERCTATASLTEAEAKRMNELPDAENEAGTEPFLCEFEAHGSDVLHTYCVQSQFDGKRDQYVCWWLRWDDDGHREIKAEPACGKPMREGEDATCLLVTAHPGECYDGPVEEDGGTDWTLVYAHAEDEGWAWEVYEGNRLLDTTTEFTGEQHQQAQAWAAEGMLDFWEVKVLAWTRDESAPDRWLATVEGEE